MLFSARTRFLTITGGGCQSCASATSLSFGAQVNAVLERFQNFQGTVFGRAILNDNFMISVFLGTDGGQATPQVERRIFGSNDDGKFHLKFLMVQTSNIPRITV
jgi:hypothetical protein